jgi:hypothetical protein
MTKGTAKGHWYQHKKVWIISASVIALVLLVFYGFDPIIEWRTRKALEAFKPAYVATFEHAKLHPFKLNYAITHLKVLKQSAGGDAEPYVYVDTLEVNLYGRELLHRHVVAALDIHQLKLNLIAAPVKADEQMEAEVPDLSDKLAALFPLTVDRVQLKNAEVKYTDKTNADFPKIWAHAIDATLENLATRAALSRGEPTSIAVSGKLQKSGEISAFITADPLAKGLFFAGRANVNNFELNELRNVMASKSGLTAEKGTLDLFAEVDCRDGKLKGGVKPVLKNVEVGQGKPGIGNAIKKVLASAAVKIFSDRVEGRESVATVVPIRGDINNPEVQLWPAVAGVIRNAFVIGVSESFERLPPPADQKNKGPLHQVIDALDKKSAPKAEPNKS